jgi:hypothetical protein
MRVIAGFALLIVGGVLALPGVPGPGIPIMLLGLVLLSDHFAWARKALAWLHERTAALRQNISEKKSKWSAACLDRSGGKRRPS